MPIAKSVIISCAGTGSRLGLAKTKALIEIDGKTLISYQLEQFKNVDDLRIVVGFQANDVIEEVLKYRRDVIFVYNHNYFETKTGASFYLGAKHANDFVIEIDGDLLVHSEDMRVLLESEDEYIAYSEKNSGEAVFVKINESGDVLSFSRTEGDYEWTGPACIKKKKIKYTTSNVYNQLEEYLPMKGIKIRAYDIDTYEDYMKVSELIKEWKDNG